MDISNMKNIVVLKNLPSNLIDEAIVVLKQNKKIKKPELIQNSKQKNGLLNTKNQKSDNDLAVKEAENVISEYISRIESQDINSNKKYEKLKNKYKKLKIVSYILAVLSTFLLILNLV